MSRDRLALPGFLLCLLPFAAAPQSTPPETAAQPAAPAAPAAPTAPKLHYSNKWRLEVSEGANNDGVITFRVTPKDGAAVEIPVSLKKGRGEDGCARDIRDAYKKALDPKTYKIEVDDGEDVLVKKHKGPDFSIELVSSTVKGTRVNLNRE
jgi:hypothetical protein